MKYKEIAAKYEVTINTVKSWKSRYWKDKKGCTQKKKVAHKKVATKIAEKMINENEELDEERQLFCIYYLKYHNQVKAYQKVKPGSPYGSACAMASRWFKEDAVQKEIDRLKKELYAEALLDPVEIVQKYIDIAFLDENELDGKAIRMADCLKALDWLSKHLNMATDEQKAKIELIKAQTAKVTGEDESEEIENDGFIDALNGSSESDWKDYGQE
nr:MAG TPA: Terminase small subunit [Caudoviricetes sp.]